jgi:GAF domain-containing protein
MKRFRHLLDQLTIGLDAQTITLEQASERMTQYLQGEMQCSQVSVWRFEDGPDGPLLRRDVGYDAATGVMPPAAGMCHPNLAPYVGELTHRGTFASDDAQNDERLAPLRDSLLAPLGIRSVLYATIGANGATWALLCCAQLGEVRHWTAQEIRNLKGYADAISLRRVRRRRREAEAASMAQRLFQAQGAPREPPFGPLPPA